MSDGARHQIASSFDVAERRVQWARHALTAAADELLQAGEHGAVVNGTAGMLAAEAERVAGLLPLIASDRARAGSDRKARDAL
jgi:hypothetical protein